MTTTHTLALGRVLDADVSQEFRQQVREALSAAPAELALDCRELTYIDSTGLGLLTLARNEAQRLGCTVRLTHLRPGHPRKVLQLMKFDQIFPIDYDEEETTTTGQPDA